MPFMVDYSADIQISDCMNDIINQVETREWNRVNDHRHRMMKKWKKEKEKVQVMKDDWEVATEKIAQENSDLHNEIKRLKDELRVKHPVIFQKTYQKQRDEIEKLKFQVKRAEDAYDEVFEKNEELQDENEKLKSALMNSSGSFKCEKCNIHLTEDDVYRSVDECEGKLLCESCWED